VKSGLGCVDGMIWHGIGIGRRDRMPSHTEAESNLMQTVICCIGSMIFGQHDDATRED